MMGCPARRESKEEEEVGEVQQFATAVPAFSSQYGGYQLNNYSYKVGYTKVTQYKKEVVPSGLKSETKKTKNQENQAFF